VDSTDCAIAPNALVAVPGAGPDALGRRTFLICAMMGAVALARGTSLERDSDG
jgi:hypothetical protein